MKRIEKGEARQPTKRQPPTAPSADQIVVPAEVRHYIDAKFNELVNKITDLQVLDQAAMAGLQAKIDEKLKSVDALLKREAETDRFALTKGKVIRLLQSLEQ